MTPNDELRSGLPVWRELATQTLQTQPLAGDARCEVLVIGGGISGALIAHTLVAEGVDTLLIDRHEPAQARLASSCSTSLPATWLLASAAKAASTSLAG